MLIGLAFALAPIVVAPVASTPAQAIGAPEDRPNLDCSLGPLERHFGGVQWFVYGCSDGKALVFFTGPDSPADLNFYFIVYPKDGAYRLYGEGVGDQALTKPAYDAITAMSSADFIALHAEASAVGL